MQSQRHIVFLSHASPEDNDFTIWLASRLKLLGYEVWVDKNSLLGGEKFWEEIDQIIRNLAVKFLLVYSGNICQKDENGNNLPGKLKDGIYKEYSLAESIGKQNTFQDFTILLNIDGSEYNLFIGADRLNQISFYDNWAEGFKQLEKKLKKDKVPVSDELKDPNFGGWYETQYLGPNRIIDKYELYYSNWWSFPLPEYFYIYQFLKKEQAEEIYKVDNPYPISKITNHLSSFQSDLTFEISFKGNIIQVKPHKVFKVKISEVLLGYESKTFPSQQDAENHLKALLKRVFHLIMKNRGMFWYEMANKKLAYYYTPANLNSLKVKFEYPYRSNKKKKTKNLLGKYKSLGMWHYAISAKPILKPIVGFSLKNHLTFTEKGFDVWENKKGETDKDRIHIHRRSKGKRFFNEEWRDMLLAFLNGLKKNDKIEIELSDNYTLTLSSIPEFFWADFGYNDPKDKTRQDVLYEYEADLEDSDNEVIEETDE